MGMSPPPATTQVSPPVQASHAQLVSVFATQPTLGQQLSPGEPPIPRIPAIGSAQARPDAAQTQLPAEQSGALAPHAIPQPPQFIPSDVVSVQVPAQQAWPAAQAAPELPQTHIPPTQDSPSAHALPIEPQFAGSVEVLTQSQLPPSDTQASPGRHWSKSPHMQRAIPAPLPGTLHALARSMSQAIPQPLQLPNEGSVRPSVPGAIARWMHEPPQQRCASVHSGVHIEGGGRVPVSVIVRGPASMPVGVHIPVNTQVPSQHSCVAAQAGSQSPLEPPPAQPAREPSRSKPKLATLKERAREVPTRIQFQLIFDILR